MSSSLATRPASARRPAPDYPGVHEVYRRADLPGEHCLAMVRRGETCVVLHYRPDGDLGDEQDCPDVYRCGSVEEARATWAGLRDRLRRQGWRKAYAKR